MHTVLRLFGPPRASTAPRLQAAGRAPYWSADTWYYPHDRDQRTVLAIRFARGVARTVEIVHAPC